MEEGHLSMNLFHARAEMRDGSVMRRAIRERGLEFIFFFITELKRQRLQCKRRRNELEPWKLVLNSHPDHYLEEKCEGGHVDGQRQSHHFVAV